MPDDPLISSMDSTFFQTPEGKISATQVWETALKELQEQIPEATFDTWVKPTFVVEACDGEEPVMVIGAHHPYAVEWMKHRLYTTIQRTVVGIVGKSVTVRYQYVESEEACRK